MRIAVGILSAAVVLLVVFDVFNTIVLARRTRNSFRITRAVYKVSWKPYAALAKRIQSSRRREAFLAVYGPLALVTIFALWAIVTMVAFGALEWAARMKPANMAGNVGDDFYLSASTFLTLESGSPQNTASRWLAIMEAALGFSLLGLVVGYLPVFYEAFASRELEISLLDARAGSPPSALELLRIPVTSPERVERAMERWEKWAAEILENHLSFPMIAWFRSHHANQSWLTALTAMTDCSAILSICAEGDLKTQAEFTFAMGRHALVDVTAILHLKPDALENERLTTEDFSAICEAVERSPIKLKAVSLTAQKLRELRRMYEPYAHALSSYLLMALPEWRPDEAAAENWRRQSPAHAETASSVSDAFRSDSDL